jgi:hypothetical protein
MKYDFRRNLPASILATLEQQKSMGLHVIPPPPPALSMEEFRSSMASKRVDARKEEHALNDEQQAVLDAALASRKHVFVSGEGGTGKTVLLRRVVAELERLHGPGTVGVMSQGAGVAKVIGGCTIFRFLNMTPPILASMRAQHPDPAKKNHLHYSLEVAKNTNWWKKGSGKKKLAATVSRLRAVVVDEISLISSALLQFISELLAELADGEAHGLPFGGAQVLLFGDYLQLPPISSAQEGRTQYAYHSAVWKALFAQGRGECFFLRKQMRAFEDGDGGLCGITRAMRCNRVTPELKQLLDKRIIHESHANDPSNPFFDALWLWPKLDKVREHNAARFGRLKTPIHTFRCRKICVGRRVHGAQCPKIPDYFEDTLSLRVGARVMVTRNHEQTVAREAPADRAQHPRDVRFFDMTTEEGRRKAREAVEQATSAPPPAAQVCGHLSQPEEEEQYDTVYLTNGMCGVVTEMVPSTTDHEFPYSPRVRFDDGTECVVSPIRSRQQEEATGTGETGAEESDTLSPYIFEQLPLSLAYSMSIHKLQGATVDGLLVVNLSGVFEDGHAYVALSRVRHLHAMAIIGNFGIEKLRCSQEVVKFYSETFGNGFAGA